MGDEDKTLTSADVSAAAPVALDPAVSTLDAQERALLAIDIAWLHWRSEFRRRVIASGLFSRPWRSVFEGDMIFSIVVHQWLTGRPITHKELATYFELFATEATVSRHIDDMEEAGMLIRRTDTDDRRRLFLIPTQRLEMIGREFLEARIRIMRDQGFAWTASAETDRKTAIDPA